MYIDVQKLSIVLFLWILNEIYIVMTFSVVYDYNAAITKDNKAERINSCWLLNNSVLIKKNKNA